ncbi:MAG: hypothetical protein IJS62_04010 [Bacteroidales bacterium]|nr:hypothetical protein [Bacteroidales bacterium]
MKGKIIISALILLAMTQAACAQIRLFPRKGQQKVLDTLEMAARDSVLPAAPADSISSAPVIVPPSVVRLKLRLPLGGSIEQKAGYMNFYEGFLLGLRQASVEGVKAEVSVQDAAEPMQPGDYDLLIDASPAQQLGREIQGREAWTVSPLEQDIEELADSCRVALVAGSWEARICELVRWIREEWHWGDKLFVLSPGTDRKTEFLKAELQHEGLTFTVLGTNYPQQNYNAVAGTARFVLVAEDAGYTASAVNFLSGPVKKEKAETAFYCTSKVRSYARRFEEDALGNANTRMVSSYYVDYDAPKVDEFILDFRRYYHAEPNQFAFHGYDTALYFVRLASVYGAQWRLGLEKDGAPAQGLLTDFRFRREKGEKGFVNTAFRRITYDANLNETVVSTTLQ